VVTQWEAATAAPVASHDRGAGFPATSLATHGGRLFAGYASGHVRVFRAGTDPTSRVLEAEIAAHARCVTAVAAHPLSPTFVSVGEDCVVNVWSLPPEAGGPAVGGASGAAAGGGGGSSSASTAAVTVVAGGGTATGAGAALVPPAASGAGGGRGGGAAAKVLLDMSSSVPHALLTGAAFVAHPDGADAGVHIVTAAYDWLSLRVFYGIT
jgi:hypothetical protein